MSILGVVFTQNPHIHIKFPDFTFYEPPNSSVLPWTFTLHTKACQASKLKQNELCYPVALLVWEDCVLSFQENLSLFFLPPSMFVVHGLKAHWKSCPQSFGVRVWKCCNCCSLPLGTSCYAANSPSAALARVGCPNTEAQFRGGRGGKRCWRKNSLLSKSNTKALLDNALSHTSNDDHIAKACNQVEMHAMTWDVKTSESLLTKLRSLVFANSVKISLTS